MTRISAIESELEKSLRNSLGPFGRVRAIRFPSERHGQYSISKCVVETASLTALAVSTTSRKNAVQDRHLLVAGLHGFQQFNSRIANDKKASELWLCSTRCPSRAMQTRIEWLNLSQTGTSIRLIDLRRSIGNSHGNAIRTRRRRTQLRWPAPSPDIVFASSSEVSSIMTEWIDRIRGIAPNEIELRPLTHLKGVRLMINGLEFARILIGGSPRLEYGIFTRQVSNAGLDHAAVTSIAKIVETILKFRSPITAFPGHPLYRLGTEAWLESRLRVDIRALDPSLDPRAVYAQVPAWRGEHRSVMDLLAITTRGRLVVIEVKASEDITLPLQGLDYWLCVEEARRKGQFQKRGFFSGVQIANIPAELWLVTPELRFHRSFDAVVASISSRVPIVKIAVGGDWRRRIIVRQRVRMNQNGSL